MKERGRKILETCLREKSKNPIDIFNNIAQMDFIRTHGPEHHVLDGAALLTAFYNAGGNIDLHYWINDVFVRAVGGMDFSKYDIGYVFYENKRIFSRY